MTLILVNNYYQQSGGEERAVDNEKTMLESRGHGVHVVRDSNSRIDSIWEKARTARRLVYSRPGREALASAIAAVRPDVVHVHNFFPLLTPSIYDACRAVDVPVVQTLHNYRIVCPGGLLMRNGQVCEKCMHASPYVSVLYRCYRGSRLGTLAVARMVDKHRRWRTWGTKVDSFVVLTEFAKEKFVEAGLPPGKLTVKPNFVTPDPGIGSGDGGYALFVGRMSAEKGLDVLLSAWSRLSGKVPLKIVGDGPIGERIRHTCKGLRGVEYLGWREKEEVLALMKSASFLVLPSVWYEGFPMVIVESFAVGLPVIGSRLGSLATLIRNGVTGMHVKPGDPHDLGEKVAWLTSHPAELDRMRAEARAEYERRYTDGENYRVLMSVYRRVLEKGA